MSEPTSGEKLVAILKRDPAVTVMSGIILLIALLIPLSAAVFLRTGNTALVEATLLLTGVFAVVGAVFGVVRGMRSGKAK